jgi:hypothetical protein
MPNPALGALQAEASVIQGHISAATAKMAEMLLTMDNPAGRLSMTKHERISRQLRLRSCAGCQCIELDPVGLLEILRGPRRCCSASQYWTSLEANEISLVGRVGVEPTVSFRRRIMSPLPATSTASGPEMIRNQQKDPV